MKRHEENVDELDRLLRTEPRPVLPPPRVPGPAKNRAGNGRCSAALRSSWRLRYSVIEHFWREVLHGEKSSKQMAFARLRPPRTPEWCIHTLSRLAHLSSHAGILLADDISLNRRTSAFIHKAIIEY